MDIQCTSMKQAEALVAVIGERNHQDRQWGDIEQRPREVGTYLTLMRNKLADAEAAFCNNDNDHYALDDLRKVVALGVACFEQHGVPTRDVPVETAAAAEPWPTKKDPRLFSVSNERLHKGYDAIRYNKGPSICFDFDVDGKTLTLTRDEIYDELEARGDGPIPF